ncbi:restriction endonuclease subunit S [Vibrio fluvialis]|nr:restriction endonuclease subunit S [Vibrio fluvialis]
MVPNEWIEDSIRSAALLITKGATPTTYGYDFVERSDASIRFVGAYNCSFDGYFKSDSEKWISIEADQMLKRSRLSLGDSIICIVGNTIGSSFLVDESVLPANINQNVAVIRPDGNVLNSVYLHFWIMSPYIQWQVLQEASTQAQPSLSLKQVGEFKILLPPLPEQKKIAQILSTWDKAIITTEQLLANSQQQKKALMQQLLTGKKRLLDKNGVRFSGEWRVSKLSKLFERVTTKNNGQSINVVTISGQHGLIRQEEFFKKAVASETLDGYFLLRQGQFAYNKSYSNGYPMGAIKRLNRYPDGVVTTLYICFELSDSGRADSDFWEHYFESGLLNKGLSQIAHEGGRAHGLLNVKPSDFFSLKVSTPSFEEQQKIAAVLSTADQEISALQQKLDALKQEKKALMQQLLTGKRRVLV